MTARKPPGTRVRGSRTLDLVPTPIDRVDRPMGRPSASPHWCPAVAEGWAQFWASPLADPRIITEADKATLIRLFDYRQRLIEALERFDEAPTTIGSQGQEILSIWAAEVHRLEAAIARLEDRFGLTPAARLKLGVSVARQHAATARAARLGSSSYAHLRETPPAR